MQPPLRPLHVGSPVNGHSPFLHNVTKRNGRRDATSRRLSLCIVQIQTLPVGILRVNVIHFDFNFVVKWRLYAIDRGILRLWIISDAVCQVDASKYLKVAITLVISADSTSL